MTDSNVLIESPRLQLSYFSHTNDEHCDFIVELYNTPLFISTEGKTSITTREAAQKYIENRFEKEYARNGYGTYLISLKPDSPNQEPTSIGSLSLSKGDSPESFALPDIGFALLPDVTGKGYATEAAQAVLQYAKEKFGLTEYFGFTNRVNDPSRKVMLRLGMESRGIWKVRCFGGHESEVFVAPGMGTLSQYGIEDNCKVSE
ncbi:hypothetical protein M422DRAFT_229818 [Sphaerobolus stellatus SS14]|uniref:N-acetyltransferase domain-containing protein n=1 Tax=Sphaerobolus stellatus (strain SS14) TaxID=990650 RepID=A0A0C9UD47_SPHS4|nr:hypothetical protein M422DRAFT_229818 [Sphaerobolus stellatus SS14]